MLLSIHLWIFLNPNSSPPPPRSPPHKLSTVLPTAFFTAKNLIKTAIKILFGTNEESSATTRQFLSFFVKFLDVMRGTFLTPQARSSTGAKELANQVFLEFERRLIKYLQLDSNGCDSASCLSLDGPITLNNLHQY